MAADYDLDGRFQHARERIAEAERLAAGLLAEAGQQSPNGHAPAHDERAIPLAALPTAIRAAGATFDRIERREIA
jgi:hypothetical protein